MATDHPAGEQELDCDVLVLGAGPGGYSAAFRAADLGMRVILVERHPSLGGVCLNVGCIPSKALVHVATVMNEAARFAQVGVDLGPARVDLAKLRAHKASVVRRLANGLSGMASSRHVTVLHGEARFVSARELQVGRRDDTSAQVPLTGQTVNFKRAIIAAGSHAMHLPVFPDDPRVVDATGALELPAAPERMLVVGGGIIGMEMATVYSTLGARLDVVEVLDGLMVDTDRDLVEVWRRSNAHRFDNMMLRTRVVGAKATSEGVHVEFEGAGAPAEPQRYDLVLQAVGRAPNGDRIGAECAGVAVGERGSIDVDRQMRTNAAHIFAVGDVTGAPMLAHRAVHQGHVAAEVAAGELLGDERLGRASFDARVIPSVAYTDPEIAWVGITEDRAAAESRPIRKSVFPWSASGRAVCTGRSDGLTKLLFDPETRRIVGGGIAGAHAGDLIGEVALAIEMGADDVDLAKTVHPHPTLGESIGLAAEVSLGTCTDLPPPRPRPRQG